MSATYPTNTDLPVQLDDKGYYIRADSTYADDRTQVLNYSETFGVFDRFGDADSQIRRVQGIYHGGTRFISSTRLLINDKRPLLLSSNVKEGNDILSVDLTNPQFEPSDEPCEEPTKNGRMLGSVAEVPRHGCVDQGIIQISRSKCIYEGLCCERLILRNFGQTPQVIDLKLIFDADFVDLFEVRGHPRQRRGAIAPAEVLNESTLQFSYLGLDKVQRTTRIYFQRPPELIAGHEVIYKLRLNEQQSVEIEYVMTFIIGEGSLEPVFYPQIMETVAASFNGRRLLLPPIATSNTRFNNWISQSQHDLAGLLAPTKHGWYPYAGVPWYNTVFGRDGILTAYQTLWAAPEVTKSVLSYLAAKQARRTSDFSDSEPGKILHEERQGEMAELGEVPFKEYFGTIDATPLFVVLAGAYFRRTNDREFIEKIWPQIRKALKWIEKFGDLDGDGFTEYLKRSAIGLRNQGWKDSPDSVSHASGELAEGSIALIEVQAYVYRALKEGAMIARELYEQPLAGRFELKADRLRAQVHEAFWDEQLECFVLALDGDKRRCRVLSSNAGHTLFTGLVYEELAEKLIKTLLSDRMNTGWGIRTLSSDAVRYNPLSYHNGSVWPHDTALIAMGMARYGFTEECLTVFRSLFDAACSLPRYRLPELYCGFDRRPGEAPTLYPVACSPQAWSVASVYGLLQAALGIDIDALNKRVIVTSCALPEILTSVKIEDLQLGEERCSLSFHRYEQDVGVVVEHKPKDWEVQIIK